MRHPDVRVISLTGSRETGVAVLKAAADGLKHVHLELGGKNAIIVLDDADPDLAVEGIIWSAFGTSGQRCTAASRVIVQRGIYEELQGKLVAAAEGLRLGYGWEDDTDVGPVINQRSLEKIHSYTEIGKDEGRSSSRGRGGVRRRASDGFYYRPTIFGDVEPEMRIAQEEEIFGPTALIPVDSFDEAIRAANGVKYGLSSSIFTRDVNKAFRAMHDLDSGSRTSTPAPSAPGPSPRSAGRRTPATAARGRPGRARRLHGVGKSVYVDYSGRLQRPRSTRPSSAPSANAAPLLGREHQAGECTLRRVKARQPWRGGGGVLWRRVIAGQRRACGWRGTTLDEPVDLARSSRPSTSTSSHIVSEI